MALIWRGRHDHRRTEREGRTLEVKLQPNGTWHLTVWKSESSSVCAGVFAAPEVACLCGETLPLSDAALAIVEKNPLSAFGGAKGKPPRNVDDDLLGPSNIADEGQ